MRNYDSSSDTASPSQIHDYTSTLPTLGDFLSPAKRNCIVDTTQNKLYRALSLHISSDNIKAAHKSSAYHLTQTKPIEGRGSGKFLNSPNIFPRTDP